MRYDAALRMQQVTHAKGNIIHARTDYVFDQNGNRSKETINRNAAAQVTNYSYDKADRLTQTEVIDVNQTVTTAYTLDSVANRTKEIITTKPAGAGSASTVTKTYTYDGRNQLTAITDTAAGNTALSYDSQGNLSQKTQGSDITYYSYNARDNLISVRKNNTVLGNYSNNHLGLRVEKEAKDPLQPNAPPAIFRTLWNGRHAFQDSDLSGNTLSRYENDGRHTVSFWSSTDGSQALHHDALGSITATTDNSGQLKSETVYDAFGNIVSRSGLSANKFGYTGHQMDQETGLIYFQARYYDPQTGRFITQDPYEGDWNTPLSLHHYLYAYGNPTTYIDLHGYQSRKPYYMSIDPVTGQKTFSDRQPAPNTEQQAANNIAREQERARKTLADKTRPSNNIDDPEFVQRRLTREAAHKPGIGGDEVEELPSQIQLRQMHARGKLALQIGGEIAEVAAPTPETIIAGPLLGGILNKAKPLLPFLKEAAKDALKAKKTEQSLAKIETAEMNSAEKVVAKAGETESTAIGKEAHRIEAERRRASGQFSTVNEAVTDKGGATIQVPHRVNLKTGDAVDARLQNAIPDAVNYERRLIVDDKPIGRPISKDRQELIRNIEAFRKREGHLPDTIAIQRYDPKTGDPVVTELYKPEDFLPKPKK